MWSFIILPDVKFQALNTKNKFIIRLTMFVCVVLNYIVVGCPWPIILGFSFLRSQGNSSFGVLVNIKLARPPITENSLNFGGHLMWKFWKTTTVHQPDKISDWSVVWITFSVDFNLPDRHQRITNKLIQARRNSDEWKEQHNWNNFCGRKRVFFAWWITTLCDNRALLLAS